MSRPDITQIRNVGDFATLYQWYVTMPKKPVGISDDDLNFRCLSTEIPKKTSQTIEVQIRGHKVRQPGIYDSTPTITLAFVGTVDNVISNFIRDWREKCVEEITGKHEVKADVEATLMLTQLDRTDAPIWQYELFGCWLEDYDPTGGQWDGASSDILRPTITVSYDFFKDKAM